ncbi:MAG: colanic acid biosynthesis acetyltransferase WcaF [Acidobacteria bacterium]|nr:colanic acid biosynthesis acetyltransferase WcaF [Acidobacteriota bacterium]
MTDANIRPASGPRLGSYSSGDFRRGRSALVEALWLVAQAVIMRGPLPGSSLRRSVLRLFGAQIGQNVTVKPGVRVKFPWRLKIGDNTWIGEDVWIDNLADVEIGDNCCLSQGAYLCTGSHNWSSVTFDLIVKPIKVDEGAWVAARASVGPGVTVGRGAVLAFGAVASHDLDAWTIYAGAPAKAMRTRQITETLNPR